MKYRIYPAAKDRLVEIWHYTAKHWINDQAGTYLRGIEETVKNAAAQNISWKKITFEQGAKKLFWVKYKRHFIFFIELSKDEIGIASILREAMDLPHRLREDTGKFEL